MNLRFFIALLLTAVCSPFAHADNIKWLATEYDFGTIREEAGKARGEVKFVNLGPEATAIQRVKSTCGCTGVSYTEGIIAPGDTATVRFDYNPTGRPGRFEKHIKVYTGVNNELMSILIKGTVIGTPKSLETKYPFANGNLRLSSDVISLGKVIYGTARHEYIHGYNQSSDTLQLSWGKLPKYISLGASSLKVPPGDLFTLSAYFNTRDGAEIGSMDIPVTLNADFGNTHTETTLHITANIEPDISALTPDELHNAPAAAAFPTILELGELNSNKPVNMEFALRNEGKSPLTVKRIHCPEIPSFIKVKSMPKSLKPEQMKQVKITVNTDKLPQGILKIPIEIVTDDPLHPSIKIYLTGSRR
ncbi:MAG: DUF1573 domain-containing protein [Prevotella sp.]|nr:DUF1573 domain-containing protein [Prevotella sp.]MCM1074581.1 DUF1573 domain-containing protein [Ruminococcus sp.]